MVTSHRRPAARYYRRAPGVGWLAALIVVPLGLGLIGWVGSPQRQALPDLPVIATTATDTDTARPEAMVAPFSLRRKGNDVVLSGQLPDPASVAFAVDKVRNNLPGTTVLDLLTPIDGVTAADLTRFDGVLKAGEPLSDFGFSIEGATITLFGTAQSDAAKLRLEQAVATAWPDLKVLDDIAVLSTAPPVPQ